MPTPISSIANGRSDRHRLNAQPSIQLIELYCIAHCNSMFSSG